MLTIDLVATMAIHYHNRINKTDPRRYPMLYANMQQIEKYYIEKFCNMLPTKWLAEQLELNKNRIRLSA